MVSEDMSSASTTTPHALLLCSFVGCNQGSTFLVTKSIPLLARFLFFLGCFFQLSLVPNTIALSPSFTFFLCLTCPALFLISAIAVTLRLFSSTGTLALGFYTSSGLAGKMSSGHV
ncbi:hypothetical protein PC128_g21639 [Phytophthora cactorum]|nr:hypothetical protein PC128_g21639 [Phytophthora cactorum]